MVRIDRHHKSPQWSLMGADAQKGEGKLPKTRLGSLSYPYGKSHGDGPVAVVVFNFLKRRWFGGRFNPEADRYMAPLLMGAYSAALLEHPLNKKSAAGVMGAEDVKTARKYVALAEADGLLVPERSLLDRRNELLKPTPELEALIASELASIAEELSLLPVGERPTSGGAHGVSMHGDEKSGTVTRHPLAGGFLAGEDFVDDEPEEKTEPAIVNKQDPVAYFRRASFYRKKGDREAALRDLDNTIRLRPDFRQAYMMRALLNHDHPEQAARDYTELIRLQPTAIHWWYERGVCFQQMGNLQRAIEDFTKMIELEPTQPFGYHWRASVYKRLGQLPEAIDDLTQSVLLDPEDGSIYNMRGHLYERVGDESKAKADFKRALEKAPRPQWVAEATEALTRLQENKN